MLQNHPIVIPMKTISALFMVGHIKVEVDVYRKRRLGIFAFLCKYVEPLL